MKKKPSTLLNVHGQKTNLVGVLGGLGPEASNAFCDFLIRYKKVNKDQDHIPFVHYCNSKIPNRIDFLEGKDVESPVPEMVRSCITLESLGVNCIVIPCNTVHSLLPEIQRKVSVPIINMIKLLVKKIRSNNPYLKKIGVLGTTLTLNLGLYERYLNEVGIELISPSNQDQEKLVMKSIYDIKKGRKHKPKQMLTEVANKLIGNGAEALILGCTEIPLVLKQKDSPVIFYEPMEVCAKEIIKLFEMIDIEKTTENPQFYSLGEVSHQNIKK